MYEIIVYSQINPNVWTENWLVRGAKNARPLNIGTENEGAKYKDGKCRTGKNAKVEKAVPENKRTENARAEDAGRGKCLHCWVICSDLQRTL